MQVFYEKYPVEQNLFFNSGRCKKETVIIIEYMAFIAAKLVAIHLITYKILGVQFDYWISAVNKWDSEINKVIRFWLGVKSVVTKVEEKCK